MITLHMLRCCYRSELKPILFQNGGTALFYLPPYNYAELKGQVIFYCKKLYITFVCQRIRGLNIASKSFPLMPFLVKPIRALTSFLTEPSHINIF